MVKFTEPPFINYIYKVCACFWESDKNFHQINLENLTISGFQIDVVKSLLHSVLKFSILILAILIVKEGQRILSEHNFKHRLIYHYFRRCIDIHGEMKIKNIKNWKHLHGQMMYSCNFYLQEKKYWEFLESGA